MDQAPSTPRYDWIVLETSEEAFLSVIKASLLLAGRLTVGGSAARAKRHRTMPTRRGATAAEVQRASAAAAG